MYPILGSRAKGILASTAHPHGAQALRGIIGMGMGMVRPVRVLYACTCVWACRSNMGMGMIKRTASRLAN